MYTEQEFHDHYLEVTDNEPRLFNRNYKPEPDFTGFWKNAFDVIEDMPEVSL